VIGRLLAGAAVLLLVGLSPPLQMSLVELDPAFPAVLFALAVVGGGLAWALRARGERRAVRRLRRCEARGLRWLGRWAWVPAIILFVLPILSHWRLRPPSGVTAYAALVGYIPWGDAHGHFEGANQLLADGTFGAFSERRPMGAALLSVRLALVGGRLPIALIEQAVLLGLAALLAARAVGRRSGLFPALGFFAIVLGLSRDYLPTTLTEPLGLTLSCLGLALFVSIEARRSPALLAMGAFALFTALHARPGAQLLAPFAALWGVAVQRAVWRRSAALFALAAAASSLCPAALDALYGAGEASFTTYPAYTLYGLSRASNWRQAYVDFPQEIARMRNEKEVAPFLYARAFANLRERPLDFGRALVGNAARFLHKLPANLSRPVSLRWLLADAEDRVRAPPRERRWDLALGGPLLAGGVLAFASRMRRSRAREERLFWLAVGLGILLSVPFVYGDAGFRGLAAGYPFIALALAVGLGGRRDQWLVTPTGRMRRRQELRVAAAFALALVAVAFVGPALAHAYAGRLQPHLPADLPAGRELVVRLETSPTVLVTNFQREGLEGVPSADRGDFLRLLSQAGIEYQTVEEHGYLEQLRPPFALLSGYDFVSRRQKVMVAPPALLRERATFVKLWARPAGDSGFLLEVERWEPLRQPPRVADVERGAQGHQYLSPRAVALDEHEARGRRVDLGEDDALRPPVRGASKRGPGHQRGEPGAVEPRGHDVPRAQRAVAAASQPPEHHRAPVGSIVGVGVGADDVGGAGEGRPAVAARRHADLGAGRGEEPDLPLAVDVDALEQRRGAAGIDARPPLADGVGGGEVPRVLAVRVGAVEVLDSPFAGGRVDQHVPGRRPVDARYLGVALEQPALDAAGEVHDEEGLAVGGRQLPVLVAVGIDTPERGAEPVGRRSGLDRAAAPGVVVAKGESRDAGAPLAHGEDFVRRAGTGGVTVARVDDRRVRAGGDGGVAVGERVVVGGIAGAQQGRGRDRGAQVARCHTFLCAA
jgi:hypothetical protein